MNHLDLFSCLFIIHIHIVLLLATECPIRYKLKCDDDNICIDECVPGFFGECCDTPCQKTCEGLRCEIDRNRGIIKCTDGCIDGYYGSRCVIPCPESCLQCDRYTHGNCTKCKGGRYGKQCQKDCLRKCNGFACHMLGTCLGTCMDGRLGQNCNHNCSSRFLSCRRDTGQCVQCADGFYGDNCERQCTTCIANQEDYACKPGCKRCDVTLAGVVVYPEHDYYWMTFIIGSMITVVLLFSSVPLLRYVCTRRSSQGPIADEERLKMMEFPG
ncbi:platelet endothelial aggregation receptor 1-like [Haliotis cracherodii]|uniref:platelet endothelial aggregation receptor 1-like n=1 Tax=Haliotis cracherodii TaxID=6455 RepID=UPI0039E77273